MDLRCRITTLRGAPALQVSGEVDLSTLPSFRDQLLRLVDDNVGCTVLVDVDGVTALDDAGLGMVLGAAGRARQRGGDLSIVCTADHLLRRFAVTGLDRAVAVLPEG
jgi:anti-sigma B factor antagonist